MTSIEDQLTSRPPVEKESAFNFKKLFSDVAVYSSGNFLIKGLSLISAPIFTRLFDPAQYGAWGFINVAVTFMTGILLLGGDNAYTRYYFQCKDEDEKRSLTTTWLLFLFAWSLIVIVVLLPFSGLLADWILGSEDYRAAFTIGLLSSPLVMINMMLSQALRNNFEAKKFALLNFIQALLTICLAVVFVTLFSMGVSGALLGAASAALVMIPMRIWSVRKMLGRRLMPQVIGKLLSFGLPLVPMNIAFWLLSNADRVMLARLGTLADVGLYTITTSMTAVIMLLQNAVGQSWLPHGIKVYEEDQDLAAKVFKKTMLYFLAGSAVVITGFVALAQEVLFILVPPEYYGAYAAIPFLASGFLFFTSAHVSVVAVMAKNKTAYIMYATWVVAAINIGLNSILIPAFGLLGAGAATGLSYMLFALGYALSSKLLWPVSYPLKIITGLLLVPLIAIFSIAAIAHYGPGIFVNLILKMAVFALSVLLTVIIVGKAEGKGLKDVVILIKQFIRVNR